jgi:hypothetical protein
MVLSYGLGILRPEVSLFATTSGSSGDRLCLGLRLRCRSPGRLIDSKARLSTGDGRHHFPLETAGSRFPNGFDQGSGHFGDFEGVIPSKRF